MSEYVKPGWFSRTVLNAPITLFARLGVSLSGAQVLSVEGRASGEWHSVPVNPLSVGGERYLVSPRGNTQWARNLRANPSAKLRLGRSESTVTASEVADSEKLPVLKAYIDRWGGVTHSLFGVSRHPDDAEIAGIASRSPVFRITASAMTA